MDEYALLLSGRAGRGELQEGHTLGKGQFGGLCEEKGYEQVIVHVESLRTARGQPKKKSMPSGGTSEPHVRLYLVKMLFSHRGTELNSK